MRSTAEEEYAPLSPENGAYYDGVIEVDLSTAKPMIAMPFHPSNAYEIDEVNANLSDILAEVEKKAVKTLDNPKVTLSLRDKVKNGRLMVDQGVIAGCAGGTYENICEAADMLSGAVIGADEFSLSVLTPSSQPVMVSLFYRKRRADKTYAGGRRD